MNKFIEITNAVIAQLVLTHKILLSRVEYSVFLQVFEVKIVFCSTKDLKNRKAIRYSFCPGGGCGFREDSQELLKQEFTCFLNENFKEYKELTI